MPNILTSWKEISHYLGKGVRTVQRWEREAGLPVRRENPARQSVLAIPEELDEWARSRTRGPAGPVAETLRKELTALREETSELRRRLDFIEGLVRQPRRRREKAPGADRRRRNLHMLGGADRSPAAD